MKSYDLRGQADWLRSTRSPEQRAEDARRARIATEQFLAANKAAKRKREMSLKDRIGFDAGTTRLEDALEWAAANEFHYLDFNADIGPNHLDTWSKDRIRAVRETCERNGIQIGVHTLSAVNVAEFSPYVSRGVDEYLRANLDLANNLGCQWTIVHAGYNFSGDVGDRRKASLERLKRIAKYGADTGARIILENLNREPDHAEVHYMAHTVEECRLYFDEIGPDRLGWAFTANHSHLVPEGIDGFLDAFGIERIGEVRLADNTGEYEVHMLPGEGTLDFESMFSRLQSAGYRGHYSMAFGSPEDKIKARDQFGSYE
ncbi:MAG: sugar phosphate isomerase/epimerase family protein [Dehalococcoidia bacterium]